MLLFSTETLKALHSKCVIYMQSITHRFQRICFSVQELHKYIMFFLFYGITLEQTHCVMIGN